MEMTTQPLKQKLILDDEISQGGGYERNNTYGRTNTFSRVFTFDRTMTQVFGIDLQSEEAWTEQLINNYVKIHDKGVEGDIPIPQAFAREKSFWKMMGCGIVFGCVIGICGLIFMNFAEYVPKLWVDNDEFGTIEDCDYYGGKTYWIAILSGTGFVVGFIRWFFDYPENLPGLFKEVNDCHVEPTWAPLTGFISMISLAGGACLGPEQALGNLGGGIATYTTEHLVEFEENDRKLVVLSGMTAALGALFPTPILAVLMMYELGNPPKSYMESIIVLSWAASISFIIYYSLSEKTYLEHVSSTLEIDIPNRPELQISLISASWQFEEWQCFTAIAIGAISGAVSLVALVFIGICKQIFLRMKTRMKLRNKFLGFVLPTTIGGLCCGLVYWALPLTVGNGQMSMGALIKYNNQLDTNLILSCIFAKMFTLGVSMNCGFVGGFVFPMISIGLMCGILCFKFFPYLPLGLCIGTFITAVPSGICPLPFTLAGLVIYIYYFGLYQTAPIFIATITSYTCVCGTGIFGALASRAQKNGQQAVPTTSDDHVNDNRDVKNDEKTKEENYAIAQYLGTKKRQQSNDGEDNFK